MMRGSSRQTLRVVTRGSALARWQTEAVAEGLRRAWPGLEVRVELILTRGDADPSDRLVGRLDKGFFTAELEDALLGGRADVAVHSLKDLPTTAPEGLALGAVLARGPVEDWLLIRPSAFAPDRPGLPLQAGARVGTSAPRREALIRRWAPDATPLPLRGNVPTRVQRLREGRYEAIVLAAAGLTRLELDLSDLVVLGLDPTRYVPAPGQGAIAVQQRAEDAETAALLAPLHHPPTADAVSLERALLAAAEAGCAAAFGALATDRDLIWARQGPLGWRRHRVRREALGHPLAPDELKALLVDPNTLWEEHDAQPRHTRL